MVTSTLVPEPGLPGATAGAEMGRSNSLRRMACGWEAFQQAVSI